MRTKNTLAAATALILSIAALSAGEAHAQDLSLGFDAGLSMTTFSGENIAGLDHRAGLTAGVSMAWRPDDRLSLETGASWIRKGATGAIPGAVTGFDETLLVNLRLDYLQLPALVRLHLPSVGMLQPSFLAGPAVAFESAVRCRRLPRRSRSL